MILGAKNMNKRRRSGSVATISDESDEFATPERENSHGNDVETEAATETNTTTSTTILVSSGNSRKKKKLDPSDLCQQLFDSIRNVKKEDGNMLCDSFIRAPKRRSLPGYYEVVTDPIDLLRVQQKLKTDIYESLDELISDFELLVTNTKAFYKPDTPEYQDACTLWDLVNANKAKILNEIVENSTGPVDGELNKNRNVKPVGRPRKSIVLDSSDDDEIDVFEELFASVLTAVDAGVDSRPLYLEFQLLPSKKYYPDYYSTIENPIDLKIIATKIQKREYETLDDMERDLLLMVKNACTYNEPGSQIYEDAKALKRIFTTKKIELKTGRAIKTQSKQRGQSLSALTAALQEEPESSDEEMEDANAKRAEALMGRIFNQLNNHPNSKTNDEPLGVSLWRLPHPRWEKEFYERTRNPISMSQIQTKIKKGQYTSFAALKSDFERMCDNAINVLAPEHRMHVAALQLRSLLPQKFACVIDPNAPTAPGTMEESDTLDTDTSSILSSSNNTYKTDGKLNLKPPIIPTTIKPLQSSLMQSISKPKLNFHSALVKNKLINLHKTLMDCTHESRRIIESFIEKPSEKLYPDYYEIIEQPIDMTMIEANIKNDKYSNIDEALTDYRRMFSNCRKYNEDNSTIYEDANVLERVLNDKIKEFCQLDLTPTKKVTTNGGNIIRRKLPTIVNPQIENKCRKMYDLIRDYKEANSNRQLSLVFMRLPSKTDYPDYYEIIKNPIDMEKIFTKIKQQQYTGLDDLTVDFLLLFKNACTYNETDSQIYKDAMKLQDVCLEVKRNLKSEENVVPDIQAAVQDMLNSLYNAVLKHEDDDGRSYSESLAEVPEHDLKDNKKVRAITLDIIKRRLDKGLYKRLDVFQDDLFACLERVRRLAATNSQAFDDSLQLQLYFMKRRDELCKNGESFSSPALAYNMVRLTQDLEVLKQTKLAQNAPIENDDDGTPVLDGDSMIINDKLYSPGDFISFKISETGVTGIMCVEKLWINTENIPMMSGNLFLRPQETQHSALRRFIDKEVFKSDKHAAMPLNKLIGKCYVMCIKDYPKLRPEGFLERDLYVCESRYNSIRHTFKKIRSWNHVTNKIRLVQRETPLEIKRSAIKKFERTPEELAEIEAMLTPSIKPRVNVPVVIHGVEEGRQYYDQYNLSSGLVLKTGDFVYTESIEIDNPSIVQVCAIYEAKDGTSYFRGPYLKLTKDLPTSLTRMFYPQEIYLSTLTETTPTSSIQGKCCVMESHEYTTRRPTEITEKDVFICESAYDEVKNQLRRLSKPGELKKIVHGLGVVEDEIYFFKRAITPHKIAANDYNNIEHIKQFNNITEDDFKDDASDFLDLNEDSMDIESLLPEAVVTSSPASQRTPPIGSPAPSNHLNTTEKATSRRSKTVTGFILFQSQYRRQRHEENPGSSFGEVSRMLGEEWKNMGPTKRAFWKEKAIKANKEAREQFRVDNPELFLNETTTTSNSQRDTSSTGSQMYNNNRENPILNQVFDCCWVDCDYEFEDPGDLLEHALLTKESCVQRNIKKDENGVRQFECLWRTCNRIRRGLEGFPDWPRLLRHVREVHIYRHPGKIIEPENRGINYVPRKTPLPVRSQTPSVQSSSRPETPNVPSPSGSPNLSSTLQIETNVPVPTSAQTVTTAGPTPEPLFITVPPRPQRVLHSEAYIKYIESLQPKAASKTTFEKTLRATQENTPAVDISKLPSQWLGKRGQEKPEEVVNALWNLRNFMMQDVLALFKVK